MQKRWLLLVVALMLSLLVLGACSSSTPAQPAAAEVEENDAAADEDEHTEDEDEHTEDEDEHTEDEDEHTEDEDEHAHVEAPEEYANLTNPFADDHEAAEAGEALFQASCASCHGPEGAGDGPAAEALEPKPASLSDETMMAEVSDGYLFWRVTEGGLMEPFNSAMPPWGDALSEDERWQLVTYLRELSEAEHD